MSPASRAKQLWDSRIGEIHDSMGYGLLEVVSHVSGGVVNVKFLNTGFVRSGMYSRIIKDGLKDFSVFRVSGKGINLHERPSRIGGVPVKEYRIWRNMLDRCYSVDQAKLYPTYAGCSVSENFKDYTYFYDWCQRQIGFSCDYHLDKDILGSNNLMYSEETCVFVPQEINNAFIIRLSGKKETLGVQHKKVGGKYIYRGRYSGFDDVKMSFETLGAAIFFALDQRKKHMLYLADKFSGKVDARVIERLKSWYVDKECVVEVVYKKCGVEYAK